MVASSGQQLRIDNAGSCMDLVQHRLKNLLLPQVEVLLHEGEFLLTGSVSSWHEKQLAQESVRSVDGGRRIRNQLSVV